MHPDDGPMLRSLQCIDSNPIEIVGVHLAPSFVLDFSSATSRIRERVGFSRFSVPFIGSHVGFVCAAHARPVPLQVNNLEAYKAKMAQFNLESTSAVCVFDLSRSPDATLDTGAQKSTQEYTATECCFQIVNSHLRLWLQISRGLEVSASIFGFWPQRFAQERHDSTVPTLTTRDDSLWVWGPNPELPQFGRFLTMSERAALQGLPKSYARLVPSNASGMRIFGDAMCVNCLGLVLASAWANFKRRRDVVADRAQHLD